MQPSKFTDVTEEQFAILIFQCLVSIFDTGSLYSFKAKVIRVLDKNQSTKDNSDSGGCETLETPNIFLFPSVLCIYFHVINNFMVKIRGRIFSRKGGMIRIKAQRIIQIREAVKPW